MYYIEFKNKWHIKDFVSQLIFLNQLKRGDTANIRFDFNANTIMPQYLAIIVSAINNAKLKGIQILFPDYNKHIKQNMLKNKIYHPYAARMDFFKLLGIKYSEKFTRRDASGNFLEITQMDICENSGESDIKLVNKIIKIFKQHFDVEESVLASLNFCLWELVDNIKNHSASNSKYTIVAQYYPINSEICLCIIDNGIGIYKALTETEGSRYSFLTHKGALEKCTENNVTDGKGAGFGLYAYKNFVLQNKGELIIYSGSYYHEVNENRAFVNNGPYWQGTIIYNKIKTKNIVDYKAVFGDNIPTTVDEYEMSINNLW